jgi:proteasome-associated ATPase
LVIGASNREELIDPAILRPGRLDVKIKIERPDKQAAKDIFKTYLKIDLPLSEEEVKQHDGDKEETVKHMISETVEDMYQETDRTRFLEVTYQNGDKETLYFKDFSSGAMIENIVRRAKKLAIKREISGGASGICLEDLISSVKQEFKEQEDLPNTTNPDDWARISGKKGEKIVFVRTIIQKGKETEGVKQIDQVVSGQYL